MVPAILVDVHPSVAVAHPATDVQPVSIPPRMQAPPGPLEDSFGQEILLGFLRDARFRVVIPFRVRFEQQEGRCFAAAADIDEFGSGATKSEALEELVILIADLYDSLERQEQNLGHRLAETLAALRKHLKKANESVAKD